MRGFAGKHVWCRKLMRYSQQQHGEVVQCRRWRQAAPRQAHRPLLMPTAAGTRGMCLASLQPPAGRLQPQRGSEWRRTDI